jgi:hypothetical protein
VYRWNVYGFRRLAAIIALLAIGAVAGVTGAAIAPLGSQPADAGFWTGVVVVDTVVVLIVVYAAVREAAVDLREWRSRRTAGPDEIGPTGT